MKEIKIKNKPEIVGSKSGFRIYLNGKYIMGKLMFVKRTEMEVLREATKCLEELKAGEYHNEEIQEIFDSLINE